MNGDFFLKLMGAACFAAAAGFLLANLHNTRHMYDSYYEKPVFLVSGVEQPEIHPNRDDQLRARSRSRDRECKMDQKEYSKLHLDVVEGREQIIALQQKWYAIEQSLPHGVCALSSYERRKREAIKNLRTMLTRTRSAFESMPVS